MVPGPPGVVRFDLNIKGIVIVDGRQVRLSLYQRCLLLLTDFTRECDFDSFFLNSVSRQ
jgi:hypothetical protein